MVKYDWLQTEQRFVSETLRFRAANAKANPCAALWRVNGFAPTARVTGLRTWAAWQSGSLLVTNASSSSPRHRFQACNCASGFFGAGNVSLSLNRASPTL